MTRSIKTVLFSLVLVLALGALPVSAADGGVVNINTADAQELSLLPRVGPAVAERIIAFRDENGKFESLEDLLLVRGIGEKTFERMEAHVTLSGETTLTEKVRSPRKAEPSEG